MTHPVFVYGSLMEGFHNHVLLECAQFQGRAHLACNQFTMLDLGLFPGLIDSDSSPAVVGEVYLVDDATLARVDRLEGHPTLYRRRQVTAHFEPEEHGVTRQVWVYVLATRYGTNRVNTVRGGDWRAHRRRLEMAL